MDCTPPATIDAVSLARGDRAYTAADIDHYGSTLPGNDFCGPNADIITDPTALGTWQEIGRAQTLADPLPTSNGMELTLRGLASATLDVGRMSLDATAPLRIASDSDDDTAITLIGAWPAGTTLRIDGAPGPLPQIEGNTLRITVSAGQREYVLR